MTAVTPDAMTGPGGLVIDLGGSRKRHASEFAVKAVLTGAVATTVSVSYTHLTLPTSDLV